MNPSDADTSLRFVNEGEFRMLVFQSRKKVLAAFLAPWSKPCRVMEPVLLKVAEACADYVQIVKINADDNPCLSLVHGVQNIPALLYFSEGELLGRLVGTASTRAILELIARGGAVPPQH